MAEQMEREIWVWGNRIFLGEDNIVYSILMGEHDEKIAIACREAIFKLLNIVEGRGYVFGDLNKARKLSPEARKIWRELSEHEKIGKIAFFGLHPVARVLSSFVMGVNRKKDMRFFLNKEEALAWLKGGEAD